MRVKLSSCEAEYHDLARHSRFGYSIFLTGASMKKVVQMTLILAVFAGAAFARGATVAKEGRTWLAQYGEAASVNVNGSWHSKEWGTVNLIQQKDSRDVTGTGDGWDIVGVVSGNKVYLLFADKKGNLNYTATLTAEGDNKIEGTYARYGSGKTRPMLLTK